MSQPPDPETENARIRRSRNKVLALLLVGFVVLVYAISIVKMG
ncbi:MAG: hypothetical protein R3E09_03715 [Novosphingobium sp.]